MKALLVDKNRPSMRKKLVSLKNCDIVTNDKDAVRSYTYSLRNCRPYDVVFSSDATLVGRLRDIEGKIRRVDKHLAKMIVVSRDRSYRNILDAFERGADEVIGVKDIVNTCKQFA